MLPMYQNGIGMGTQILTFPLLYISLSQDLKVDWTFEEIGCLTRVKTNNVYDMLIYEHNEMK